MAMFHYTLSMAGGLSKDLATDPYWCPSFAGICLLLGGYSLLSSLETDTKQKASTIELG